MKKYVKGKKIMIPSKFNRVPKSKGNKDDQEFRWHLISRFSLSIGSVFRNSSSQFFIFVIWLSKGIMMYVGARFRIHILKSWSHYRWPSILYRHIKNLQNTRKYHTNHMTCIHFCQTSVTFLFNVIILEMDYRLWLFQNPFSFFF